jgi:pimeloyl-ACP methyl ester carboxylesterase
MRPAFAAGAAMKRWEMACALLGVILLFLGVRWIRYEDWGALQQRDFVLDEGGCRIPLTVIEPQEPVGPRGTVLVFHGLAANRRIMFFLSKRIVRGGYRVYVPDLPGHGDNADSFSFGGAQHCAEVLLESLTRSSRINPKTTVLVGHSMGAAIAIRMADREPVAATIAISPGPTPLPQRMPANLLVFSAQYDIGLLKRQAERLQQAAEGIRTSPEDFIQHRAFDLQFMPRSTHTSLIFDTRVTDSAVKWMDAAVGPEPSMDGKVGWTLVWAWHSLHPGVLGGTVAGFIGLVLLFPFCATATTRFARLTRTESDDPHPSRALALAEGTACAFAGVLILMLGTPLKFLHIYTGDYLASLLLIVGALLLLLNWKIAKANFSISIAQKLAAIFLGLATILAFGAWLNWQLDDAWLNTPRWLRFAALLPILWIFCYAEEVMLGPVGSGKRRAFRFAIFLLLRLELWTACAVAAYSLASGQILLVILFTFLLAFSILQRLATDALRARTGSAPAAALFSAILAAWFIAAVFPLT